MRIFKTTYTYKGKLKKCKVWYIEFEDHLGLKQSIPGDKSRDVAMNYGRQIETLVYLRKRNQVPDMALLKWVNAEIPEKLRSKLFSLGVVNRDDLAEGKPLSDHLEAFKEKLKTGFRPKLKSGCTEGHVEKTHNRVKSIIDGCGFKYWPDIHFDRVQKHLAGLDVSDLTYNYYRRDFSLFVRWMLDSRRAQTTPAGHLPKLEIEKKAVRRPLTEEEVPLLLQAAVNSPETRFGMTGYERAVLYLMAVETGLRATELKNLTVSCFDLKAGFVTLDKTKTKNRKEAVLPLKKSRIENLKKFLDGKGPEDAAFGIWENPRSAEMIRADLAVSEVKTDEGLPVKFHSLRDTFITSLDKTSASLAERMTLARHSMAGSLTLGTYTHVKAFNLKKVIEELPAYEWPKQETKQCKIA
jgi:integrase